MYNNMMLEERLFGLIGKNISYSFSKQYFLNKFNKENITKTRYGIFDLAYINNFEHILRKYPNLQGVNITIPYKKEVIQYVNYLSDEAYAISAVNTIKIKENSLIGYNTDIFGFKKTFAKHLLSTHKKALVLGNGGAAKAVIYVLKQLKVPYLIVSRNKKGDISYKEINEILLNQYKIIIHCTPIGTYPTTDQYPLIPYQFLTKDHYLYDLVYNPLESKFLKKGTESGAIVKNGLEMLYIQGELGWDLWNH
ncbi:shikimate dehydrogenase substrate binding subunit [Candidatus Uzinura diaspidicola str. ASNER]|uniref:Shikimate dehydrogenase substrate binding subunit n=1 Tax=Candidatus Uzinura diaspidicola str. ASNER TaxID=1133592 RepID=L7VFU3_9FLAO|nr:shikimate dehydrogenase substrate binding subunit [Candidatus Uzinura diaspidicola str. ASNER]